MGKKSVAAPSIELFMYSLNQEFPVGKGHGTFLKRTHELQPSVGGKLVEHSQVETQIYKTGTVERPPEWISNEWIENHTKVHGLGRRAYLPLVDAILRREDFGAILFDQSSDRVFKLNEAAADLFQALRQAAPEGVINFQAVRSDAADKTVREFVETLRSLGIVQ